ncbi:MAG: hypothetical protein WAN65_12895 [Candidatus Sulfotelmatobacter sp.]
MAPHCVGDASESKAWATSPADRDETPFAFAQGTNGNNYDVARDLSKFIYQRPGGQFDLYLLSQK